MKNLVKTKWFIYGTYLLLVLATLLIGFILFRNNNTLKSVYTSFFEVAESRTFDYRQSIRNDRHKCPPPNQDIVVLAIDDASVEFLGEKYGEWPIPRNIYADIINYIEAEKPQAIVFDLMFLKSIRVSKAADNALISAMNKYDNIYTGINFDGQDANIRTPMDLPERLSVSVQNDSKINYKEGKYRYTNCRPILDELINGKVNIASTNIIRSKDGIIRTASPFLIYKDNYYPYLSFKVGSDYLKQSKDRNYTISSNNIMKVEHTELPLNNDGEVILNWYGQSGTHYTVPFYRVLDEIEGKNTNKIDFKNKIILIGTTAMSMHDTKSVPIQKEVYPGVEVHATFINNMIDNNFIQKTNRLTNILILAALVILVGGIVMLSTSTIFAFLSTTLFGIAYLFLSYYIMEFYNLWIPVVIPTIAIVASFILSFLAKYLMKSRDFEYQYKLATIDGLTELYNHRYFQDTLRKQIDIAKRYNQPVSLIICDIDFFKKFNDTYGHQTGDAVLRQVAQTLRKNSRTTDYVCRYGGEEMSIILPNTKSEEALMLAERICKAVGEKPFHITPVDSKEVTISLGVATFPDNAQTPQDLIEWADKGLYYAKEHGRNQVGRY